MVKRKPPEGLLEGAHEVDIVGESFYPESFDALRRGDCYAVLRHDSANPYDCNAVTVIIDGHQVGHLSKDIAARLCEAVARRTESHGECVVRAEIAGGRDRGTSSVKISLPPPEAF